LEIAVEFVNIAASDDRISQVCVRKRFVSFGISCLRWLPNISENYPKKRLTKLT
jgi:hypothetical protein